MYFPWVKSTQFLVPNDIGEIAEYVTDLWRRIAEP